MNLSDKRKLEMGNDFIDFPRFLYSLYPYEVKRGRQVLHRMSPTRMIKCKRGAFMEALGYREPLNPVSEQNMDFGSMRHEKIQDILVDHGILQAFHHEDGRHEAEYKIIYDNPPLEGYVDGVLTDGISLLEIKTTGKPPGTLLTPLSTHVDQAQIYMHITEKEQTYILYESKGLKGRENPWTQFVVKYDPARAQKLMNRGNAILESVKKRQLPWPDANCYCTNPACHDEKIHQREGL